MVQVRDIRDKLMLVWPHLNERSRRMLAATEALGLGYGGVSLVSRACGLSRVTITKGIGELAQPPLPEDRVRREGGGRWSLVERDPRLPGVLDALVEPLSRGDPESPLRWTCKSTRTLAAEWGGRGVRVNAVCPGWVITEMDVADQAGGSYSDADITRRVPMGRFAKPDDVARAIAFLADDAESGFVNGHTLTVDGGWSSDGSWESVRLRKR